MRADCPTVSSVLPTLGYKKGAYSTPPMASGLCSLGFHTQSTLSLGMRPPPHFWTFLVGGRLGGELEAA